MLASLNIKPLKSSLPALATNSSPSKAKVAKKRSFSQPKEEIPFTKMSTRSSRVSSSSTKKEQESLPIIEQPSKKEAALSLEVQKFKLDGIKVIERIESPIKSPTSISTSLSYKEPGGLVKLTPERIYSMVWHSGTEDDNFLLFAGDKSGNLGLLSLRECRASLNWDEPQGVLEFAPFRQAITCMKFSPLEPFKLFMSSYDGTIRVMDLLHSLTISVVHVDTSDMFTGIDFDAGGNLLWYSTVAGNVGRLDLRTGEPASVFNLHEKKTQCVSTNWQYDNFFCTSSLDNTVCIWDARMIGEQNSLEPVKKFTQRRSVTSAYFHKYDGSKLVTTCYDDYLRLYDNVLSETCTQPHTMIRHNNQTGKWITTFKANWDNKHADNSFFVIGDMEKSTSIFDGKTGSFLGRLDSEYLTAQPAVNAVHPRANLIAGGTARGKVCIWS